MSRSSEATASASSRFNALATGALRYRSAAVGSPLLKSSVSASASPRSTCGKAWALRRKSPISLEPWANLAAMSAASTSGSAGKSSGNFSPDPILTTKPSPFSSKTPA